MTKIKWTEIVEIAEDIKKGVETNAKIPSVKGYSQAQLLYIMGEAVRNPKKDVEVRKVSPCPDCTGSGINTNLSESEYKKLAYNTNEWIRDRNIAPNYTVHGKYMISNRLELYCFSKIVVWYDEHKKLPRTCLFNNKVFYPNASNGSSSSKSSSSSTSSNKKYGHATKSGCDNMGQNTDYYCGVHSLQEVIRNLYGIVVPQSTLASWAGTTTAGTSHQGLETAVAQFNKKYGKNLKIIWKNFSELGWSGIKKIVNSTNQDCIIHNLYRRNGSFGYGHYEVVNAVNANVTVQNSLGNYCSNGCHCGYIEYRSQSTFTYYIQGISQKSIAILTRG